MINIRNNAVGVSLCRNQSRNNVEKMNTYGVVMLMLMLILEDCGLMQVRILDLEGSH